MRILRTVISLVTAWNFLAAIQRGEPLWRIALMGFVAVCLWPWSSEKSSADTEQNNEDDPAADAFVKAGTDYARIQSALEQIRDPHRCIAYAIPVYGGFIANQSGTTNRVG